MSVSWLPQGCLIYRMGWKLILAYSEMTEERASACVQWFFCLFVYFNFKELLDISFEPQCVNCFLGCRGDNTSKHLAPMTSLVFIRVFLLKYHCAPFWTSDMLWAWCFVNIGSSALILPFSIWCHAASALLCSVLPGYAGAGVGHAPSVVTKEEMPCAKLLGFHWEHTAQGLCCEGSPAFREFI